jgi:hypothetical protein
MNTNLQTVEIVIPVFIEERSLKANVELLLDKSDGASMGSASNSAVLLVASTCRKVTMSSSSKKNSAGTASAVLCDCADRAKAIRNADSSR